MHLCEDPEKRDGKKSESPQGVHNLKQEQGRRGQRVDFLEAGRKREEHLVVGEHSPNERRR